MNTEVVRELLGARDANGAPLMTSEVFSAADSKGNNALMLASLFGKNEVVQVLLEADSMNYKIFKRTDSQGRNAIMLASQDFFNKGTKAVNVLLKPDSMRPKLC